jgi:hypothetical protein
MRKEGVGLHAQKRGEKVEHPRSHPAPYTAIIPARPGGRRPCRCLDCGQVRINKEYV